MATPHVAGAAALVLAATPTASPAQVASTLTRRLDAEQGHQPRHRLAEPPAVRGQRRPRADPDPDADPDADRRPPTGCTPAPNGTDIRSRTSRPSSRRSPIAGCSGNASATAQIDVNIVHTYIGDLVVDLIAPDGSVYVLHNRAGGSADNINQTYTVNLSSEAANGTWELRVRDAAAADSGYINSWSLRPGVRCADVRRDDQQHRRHDPRPQHRGVADHLAGCTGNAWPPPRSRCTSCTPTAVTSSSA